MVLSKLLAESFEESMELSYLRTSVSKKAIVQLVYLSKVIRVDLDYHRSRLGVSFYRMVA
jgi:hypothetical protein